jgi:hypothetical protein
VTYTAESGRLQILGDVAGAADDLAEALSALGDAYDRLDEQSADRMEEELFRPLQSAYGQLKRTSTEFAARYSLTPHPLRTVGQALPADPRLTIERAAEAVRQADEALANLQDSMLPVDVGDRELRAGLSEVRSLIAPIPGRSDAFTRTLGR